MPVRLFVGNLPYSTTEAELRAHFAPVTEPLQIVIPVDRNTGRPRGFAFVDVADRAAADEAIRRFDTQPFKGRLLAVSEARPREARPPGSGPPPARGTSAPASRVEPPAARPPGSEPVRRRKAGAGGRRERWERGPKGPIRERISGRVYAIEDEEWGGAEPADFDDFATSAPPPDDTDEPTS